MKKLLSILGGASVLLSSTSSLISCSATYSNIKILINGEEQSESQLKNYAIPSFVSNPVSKLGVDVLNLLSYGKNKTSSSSSEKYIGDASKFSIESAVNSTDHKYYDGDWSAFKDAWTSSGNTKFTKIDFAEGFTSGENFANNNDASEIMTKKYSLVYDDKGNALKTEIDNENIKIGDSDVKDDFITSKFKDYEKTQKLLLGNYYNDGFKNSDVKSEESDTYKEIGADGIITNVMIDNTNKEKPVFSYGSSAYYSSKINLAGTIKAYFETKTNEEFELDIKLNTPIYLIWKLDYYVKNSEDTKTTFMYPFVKPSHYTFSNKVDQSSNYFSSLLSEGDTAFSVKVTSTK